MRVALVSESFLPTVNGVTTSVVRAAEHLRATGHTPYVVAPGPGPSHHDGIRVLRVRSRELPLYKGFRLGTPGNGGLDPVLRDLAPDVVHLASPFVLGWYGALSAECLGIPVVAVFQTDVAAFAARYHAGFAQTQIWAHLRRLHSRAARTLAPSSSSAWALRRHGVERVSIWGRGVDLARFTPGRRSEVLRARLAPGGEIIVGYVGRLAHEKNVAALAALGDLPGVQTVVVGDGPARRSLERKLPHATFTGFLHGDELADTVASLDLFVHPGLGETFCQSVQEALASGVPVVARADGGPLDLVQHGVNGYLWAGDDPAILRSVVESLVDDPALRSRLQAAARRSVLGRTWAAVGDQLLGHYRAVTGVPAARPVEGRSLTSSS